MLSSRFLKRNCLRGPTTDWHLLNSCPKTVSYSSHGRCWFAYASVERFGGAATPKCLSLPSCAASPQQISRNVCAFPNWQNSIATNWLQQLKPLACRSALCSLTACSNSSLGNNANNCEKMLH